MQYRGMETAPRFHASQLVALTGFVAVLRRLDMYLPAPDRPLVERVNTLLTGQLAIDDSVRRYRVIVEAPDRVRVVVDGRGLTARAPRVGRSEIERTFTEHGRGILPIVAALSRRVIVESWSDGITYRQSFTDWRADGSLRVVGPTGRRGYDVVFVLGDPAALERRATAREP
jgi:DNA gyrase/topoisomerase IV subunit B